MTTTTILLTIDHDRPLPDNALAIIENRVQDFLVNGPGVRASVSARPAPTGEPTEETPWGHALVEVECVHKCLDDAGVPREEGGNVYSLWGRVQRFAAIASKVKTATSAPPSADTLKE